MRSAWIVPASAALAVGLTLGGLLVGYAPVGNDPDQMYRPIKGELASALRRGTLPFWADRFGLGIPLVAESHVAALYPPNWAFYGLLDVPTAYRLAMWMHGVATALGTFAYARSLGIPPWGAAVSGVSFALCGFQSIHSGHEPWYCAMPYLPLCLLGADRFADGGRWGWLALMALAWGTQIEAGQFQMQMMTGGVALAAGLGRLIADRRPPARAVFLLLGLGWGAAVAGMQLGLTMELVRVAGFGRPFNQITSYAFPPSHWAQLAMPAAFLQLRGSPQDAYWMSHATIGGEATLYAGTVPLILAFVGLVGDGRSRHFTLWRLLIPLSFALATMPRWSLDAFWLITRLPGLGSFRCPARYTVITSLGIALLAGHGMDRAISPRRSRAGVALAVLFGAAALAWAAHCAGQTKFRASFGEGTFPSRFGSAGVAWAVGLAAVTAWRAGRIGGWALVLLTTVELAVLYHLGPVAWGWSAPSPKDSPILQRLAREGGPGLVAGRIVDPLTGVGLTAAYPYVGISAPPPNYLLEASTTPGNPPNSDATRWMQRFGVTHGVWYDDDPTPGADVVFEGEDRVLDRIMLRAPRGGGRPPSWKVVRYPDAWPPARAALRTFEATGWGDLYGHLMRSADPAEVAYQPGDAPAEPSSPRAASARVTSWDGTAAVVEHDGACDLVVRRTYYPGWTARVDGGAARPVAKADAGLQSVRLDGSGTSRVTFAYRPSGLGRLAGVSILATAAAVLTLIWAVASYRITRAARSS